MIKVLTKIEDIRNRIEEAPVEELQNNREMINEDILKSSRKSTIYRCIKAASVVGLFTAAGFLIGGGIALKVVGFGLEIASVLGIYFSGDKANRIDNRIVDLKEVSDAIDDELAFREEE